MANLTGQQIKDTYYGLLNLNTATTGITSTLQNITDGLGNSTGSRIATNQFYSPTTFGFVPNYVPDYMGVGYNNTAVTPQLNSANKTLYMPFYDTGVHTYTSTTFNNAVVVNNNDNIGISFYTPQYVSGYGIAPQTQLDSVAFTGLTTTGPKTATLTAPLKFPTPGFYICCLYISSTAATPTLRFTQSVAPTLNQSVALQMGFTTGTAANTLSLGFKNSGVGANYSSLNFSPNPSYTAADIASLYSTVTSLGWGFSLNVSK